MAMADEGNVIVAVLAGEGSGGHRSKVVGAVGQMCMFPNSMTYPTRRSIRSIEP